MDPGEMPALPADDANEDEIARWNAELDIFLRNKSRFEEIQSLKLFLKTLISKVTPEETLDQIRHPIDGMLRITPAAWFLEVERIYGTLSTNDLRESFDQLKVKWNPTTPFSTYIATQHRVHQIQEANGQRQNQVSHRRRQTCKLSQFTHPNVDHSLPSARRSALSWR